MTDTNNKWGITPIYVTWKATGQKVPAMWITAPDGTQYGLHPVNVEPGGDIRELVLQKVQQIEPISGPLPLNTLPQDVRNALIPTFKSEAAKLGYSFSNHATEALRSGQDTHNAQPDFRQRYGNSQAAYNPDSARGR